MPRALPVNWNVRNLLKPQWRDGVLTRGAPVAAFLFLILVAYSSAQLTWMLWPGVALKQAPPPPPAAAQSRPSAIPPLMLAQELAARHLFGMPQSTANPQLQQVIPETALSLNLRGVFASGDRRSARAIIADASGQEDFYAAGGQLPGGAVLKEIHKDHVVISRNDRPEILRLPQLSLDDANNAAAMTSPAAPIVAPADVANTFRDTITRDPRALTSLVQGEPVRENDRLVGFRLQPGRDANLLNQFGLQPGDIVTAVNGIQLEDPAGRMNLMRELPNMTEVSVDVIRDGVPRSFVVSFGE